MPAPTILNSATGAWVHAAAVANVTGGATVDAESRTATNSILAALRNANVIAGATTLNVSQTGNSGTSQIVQNAAIAAPSGGATVDANTRTTIGSIRTVLQNAGLIAGATSPLGAHAFDEDSSSMTVGAHIANVTAGGTTDAECRTAINAALAAMRLSGLIAAD